MCVEAVEVAGDDGHGYGEGEHADEGAHRPDDLPARPERHLVAVADRCHGDYGPPEGVGDAVYLRVGDVHLGVVDGAGEDEETDDERDEEETETLETRLEGEDQHLKTDAVLRQLEDAHEADDAQEGKRGARLGAGAAHGRHDVDERHVVGQDGRHVDDVLEVLPEGEFARTGDEADDRLEREPGRADGLDDEERVEEVGRLVGNAVRGGEDGQRLDAEEDDGDERDDDGDYGDEEGAARRLRILEQHPDGLQPLVGRHGDCVGHVALLEHVVVHHVLIQLVEVEFGEEHVVGHVVGPSQLPAVLKVTEDRLERRSMAIDEELVARPVVEALPFERVPEQGLWMPVEQAHWGLIVLPADVQPHPASAAAGPAAVRRRRAGAGARLGRPAGGGSPPRAGTVTARGARTASEQGVRLARRLCQLPRLRRHVQRRHR